MSNDTQKLTLSNKSISPAATEEKSVNVKLPPIIGVVFIAYLLIGLAMSVLPLHVRDFWLDCLATSLSTSCEKAH